MKKKGDQVGTLRYQRILKDSPFPEGDARVHLKLESIFP